MDLSQMILIKTFDETGKFSNSNEIALHNTDITSEKKLLPGDFSMQNYPNPFNNSTNIEFSISKACEVELSIYNSVGQVVNKLMDHYAEAGRYRISWNSTDRYGSTVPSGTYFYRLITENQNEIRKMLLVK